MRPTVLPLLLVLPALVGCPSSPFLTSSHPMPLPDYPMVKPRPMPMPTSAPVGIVGGMVVPSPPLVADGPSMDDAYHYVHAYVSRHYPGAELVSVRSPQVGLPGRIAKTGSWSFTYSAPVSQAASGSTTQAVDIPSRFEGRQLTFKLSGTHELFAPEVKEMAELATIDYAGVLPLGKVLEICQGFGMAMGPAGVSAALLSDPQYGALYEIDYNVALQWGSPASGYDRGYPYVQPTPSPAYSRGKYRIDAVSGALVEHLTTP